MQATMVSDWFGRSDGVVVEPSRKAYELRVAPGLYGRTSR